MLNLIKYPQIYKTIYFLKYPNILFLNKNTVPNFLFTSYFKVLINLSIGAASYQLIF